MGLYPGSIDSKVRATTYGPLPTHGRTAVALVYHTTETRGLPGYRYGETAPHYTYFPNRRKFYQHAEIGDGYVGTMRGHTKGGHGNCKAVQLEIVAYSDRTVADRYDTGLWVGDFDDGHYEDLAAFCAWVRESHGVGFDVTPTPEIGWRSGTGSPSRLTDAEWEAFSGLTAHGAVPQNSHWDTGVLDLERISEGGNVYKQFVEGIVTGWAEDVSKTKQEFDRLYDAGILEGPDGKEATVGYWIGLLVDPSNPAWLGFYARTELSVWGR